MEENSAGGNDEGKKMTGRKMGGKILEIRNGFINRNYSAKADKLRTPRKIAFSLDYGIATELKNTHIPRVCCVF